jgi:UDP-N-acetylmuramate dehydrogenase
LISSAARTALESALGAAVAFDVPMSRHTSLRVGGPADALATPLNRDDLSQLLELCQEHTLPLTLLGGGFNTLVGDAGLDGVVVCLKKLRGLELEGEHALRAEAGVPHSFLTRFCVDRGLAGLEFAAGIPGTIGGWVAMNAGIGSRELKDVALSIEVAEAGVARTRQLAGEELVFEYRSFPGLPQRSAIVSALLAVETSDEKTVKDEVDRLLRARGETQPINTPTCGSVFKNPEGDFAGRLIEAAGLKGARVGGAQISPIHANFISNTGGATSDDIQQLIRRAQEAVERSSGVRLHPEVRIVGRDE